VFENYGKYIVYRKTEKSPEKVLLFPASVNHDEFRGFLEDKFPVSAGLFQILPDGIGNPDEVKYTVAFGESVTLGMRSRKHEDAILIEKMTCFEG